jgi:hypothetical protein
MTAEGPIFKRWMPADDMVIRSYWGVKSVEEIAAMLKRTVGAVRQRAWRVVGTTIDRDPKPGRIKGRRRRGLPAADPAKGAEG